MSYRSGQAPAQWNVEWNVNAHAYSLRLILGERERELYSRTSGTEMFIIIIIIIDQ